MSISEKEDLSLLESKENDFELLFESQKLEFELQRAIDTENSREEIEHCREEIEHMRKEINDFKGLWKVKLNEIDDEHSREGFTDSPMIQLEDNPFHKLKSSVLRILERRSYSAISNLNTETISMYAVAKVVDCNSNKAWKTFVALACFAIFKMQMAVLVYVMTEASWPTCHSMSDCSFGTYCRMLNEDFPYCADCAEFYNTTQYYEAMCPSQLGDRNWTEMDQVKEFDHTELWVKPGTNYNHTMCYGFKHCSNTDLDVNTNFKGHCDYIILNRNKMEGRTWLMLTFLGLLWALPIYQDIEEAALEEAVLDHHNSESFSFPVEVVRIALRIRRFYLPYFTIVATICLIVTDDISGKNIILNLLAITFIAESDNVFALLFLQKSQKELMEKAVEPIDIEMIPDLNIVIYWCRMQGFGCVFVLLIGIYLIQNITNRCDEMVSSLIQITLYSFITGIIAEGMFHLCFMKKDDETLFLRFINTLIETSRNFVASAISFVVQVVIYSLFSDDFEFIAEAPSFMWILIVGSPIVLICLSIFKKKQCKTNSHTRYSSLAPKNH